MGTEEFFYPKTVFICYRREVSRYQGLLLYKLLTNEGFDVFLDVETIDSGSFEKIILNQIPSRAHFIIILAPHTLDRINHSGDWLRREIEHAIAWERNIVPLFFDNFNIEEDKLKLTGKLIGLLDKYNGLFFYPDYIDAGIEKLTKRYLRTPHKIEIYSPPQEQKGEIERKINLADRSLLLEMKKAIDEHPSHQIIKTYDKYRKLLQTYGHRSRCEIDLCGKLDSLDEPTIISLTSESHSDLIVLSPTEKTRIFKYYSQKYSASRKVRIRVRLLSDLLSVIILKNIKRYNDIVIDNEYKGHTRDIKTQILNQLRKHNISDVNLSFMNLPKSSMASKKARSLFVEFSKGSIDLEDLVLLHKIK